MEEAMVHAWKVQKQIKEGLKRKFKKITFS